MIVGLSRIPVNIWDDYVSDDYGGDCEQSTALYIEEHDVLTDAMKEEAIRVVVKFLESVDLEGAKFSWAEDEVLFVGLTHSRRERLVDELNGAGLSFGGIPFDFYSES